MIKNNIYVVDNERVSICDCIINDDELKRIYVLAKRQNFEVLSCILKLILTSKSKLHLSYAINNLLNYEPMNDKDCQILCDIICNINIDIKTNSNNLTKYFLEKKQNLLSANFIDKDNFSKKSVGLPVIYSYKK